MIIHTTPAAKPARAASKRPKLVLSRSRRKLSPHFDHFERHAEEAADLIARGEVSVGRLLTRRSAGAYPLPTSVGEPLPIHVREHFEDAFGADLGAVRVHHDPPAAAAAQSERAIAFTAGRDIFFAAGEYRPGSADGLRLLAHELAHVLQQTGSPGPGGTLHATATVGSGPIQRADQEAPFATSDVSYDLDEILTKHRAAATDPIAQDEIATLTTQARAATDKDEFFTTREELALSGAKDPIWKKAHSDLHIDTLSCLYDGLKWSGHFRGAAMLLMTNSDLKTLFLSEQAYFQFKTQFTVQTLIDELYSIWNRDSFFAGARPRDVIDRMTIYLLGPTRAPSKQTLSGDRDFVVAATDELKKAEKPTAPIQNEVYFATVGAVMELEKLRFAMVTEVESKLEAKHRMAERKLLLSHRYSAFVEKEWKEVPPKFNQKRVERGYSGEALIFWARDFLQALYHIAGVGKGFWTRVTELQNPHALVPRFGMKASDVIRGMSEDDFFAPFKPAIDEVAETMLFRNPDGTLPTPQEYNSRKEKTERNLKVLSYDKFERPLANLLKQRSPDKGGPGTLSFTDNAFEAVGDKRWLRLAWVFKSITDLLVTLDRYKFRDELLFIQQAAKLDPKYPATDHRDAHRIRMAKTLGWMAQVANWTELEHWTDRVKHASEFVDTWTQTEPVVAIVGDWEEDKDHTIRYLLEESYTNQIIPRWAPFRLSEIVSFYEGQGYREFTKEITGLLGSEKGKYSKTAKPLMERAYQQARLTQPIRYKVKAENWEWAYPRPDPKKPPLVPRTIVQLVRDHPKTKALAERHKKEFKYTLPPIGIVPDHQFPDAAVWLMPQPVELIKKLQLNDAINEVMAALLQVVTTMKVELPSGEITQKALSPQTVAQLKDLPWEEWWLLFTELVDVDFARRVLDDMKFESVLDTERQAAWTALQDAQREAFIHERRRLVEHQWTPLLKAYKRTAEATDTILVNKKPVLIRSLPMEMLKWLFRFTSQVIERDDVTVPKQPDDPTPETNAHFAVAFIELSPLLEKQLGPPKGTFGIDIRGDIVFDYVPVLYTVLDRIDKGGLEPYLVQEERGQPGIIANGKARLERVLAYMEDLATRRIKDYGLVGIAGDGTIEDSGSLQPVDWDEKLDRNTPFTIDGRTWHILEVRKSFTYHPGAWKRRDKSVRSAATGSLLHVEGKDAGSGSDKVYRDNQHRSSEVLMVISQEEGGTPIEITEGGVSDQWSEDLLRDLTWDAVMHARYEHMRKLSEAIETLAQYGLDIAELFPGVGPVVAATRLVTGVIDFVAREGPAMVTALVLDPQKVVTEIRTKMEDALEPQKILEFLLFDFAGFQAKLKKPDRDIGKKVSSRSGLFRKVLRRMRTLGVGLLNTLGRLGMRVRGKREVAQMFVVQRPLLVRVISTLADYYYVFREMFSHAPELLNELAEFKTHAAELTSNLQATIDGMGDIELPKAVITVDDLVDVFIDVIGHKLGGKYKLGVQVLLKVLDVIGAKREMVTKIAQMIRDVADVKNEDLFPPWNKFLEWATGQFKRAQESLHGVLAPRLKELSVDLPAPRTTPQIGGDEFPEEIPEAMPYGEVYPDVFAAAPDLSRGAPLSPRVRAEAESRFGHDFGHVRLHTGAAAQDVNEPIGARGLTTGSHILLNESEPQSLDQSHVLRHELAHVVQQTGPRPLGAAADSTPRAGTPGGGVRVDSSAESVANRLAAQTAHHGVAQAPVDAGRGGGGGFQPSLVEAIGLRFLKYLVNYDEIEEDVAKIDARGKRRGLIGRAVRDQIAQLPQKLVQAFSQLHIHTGFSKTFGPQKDFIGKHLTNQKADIQAAIRALAIDSSDPVPLPKTGTAGKPTMQLNVRKLEAKLSRYIFGKTGILLEVDLRQHAAIKIPGKRPGPHEKLVVDNPVDKLTVRFVHLPPISSNSPLWQHALKSRPADPLHPTIPTTLTDADRTELRPRIRQVLQHMGPASTVWSRNAYELDVAVFRKVEELRTLEAQLGTKGFLPPDVLPTATEYVKDTNTQVNSAVGQIGLRLGTYNDRENHGSQWGKERESHHITQYILGAYFRNGKGSKVETDRGRRAFKLDLKKNKQIYTSHLSVTGNFVNKFSGKPGTVEIEETEKKRGGIMPAILLARPVHRLGNLHITPSADDFGDPEQTTQAGALNSVFQDALPPLYRKAEQDSLQDEANRPDYPAFLAYKQTVGDDKVAEQIYDAMQVTYRVLRDFMQPRLKTALATREREYFNNIAKDAKSPPRGEVTGRQMDEVYKAAIGRNNTVLGEKGWIGK